MKLIKGNCIEVLKTLEENSVDSVVTDPPYEIGFMGKSWDSSGIANNPEMWKECLRVLKPGGYLLSFSATRTYHRMAVGIEDAGFEIRDMIEWVYGSGFPKSHNIGKAVDKLQANEREVVGKRRQRANSEDSNIKTNGCPSEVEIVTKGTSEYEGWGTALKPAHEPICMARKPLAEKTVAENCLKYGTGGINIDESRVGSEGGHGGRTKADYPEQQDNKIYGKGLFAKAAPRVDGMGRFPANLIHDNSEEVKACFPETNGKIGMTGKTGKDNSIYGKYAHQENRTEGISDAGNASRFFKSIIYQAKPSKKERNAGCEGLEAEGKGMNFGGELSGNGKPINIGTNKNYHPTVKPIALMEYLINMVTPKGGVVLDPFMGSGTTGCASVKNGFDFIGIDMEDEYIKIATARIKHYKIF